MKALTEYENELLNKSVEMVMKSIIESGQDQAKLLNMLKKANEKLSGAVRPIAKAS